MQTRSKNTHKISYGLVLSLTLFIAALIIQSVPLVFAATMLLNRQDRVSTSAPGAVAQHLVRFTITDFATSIGSIRIEFCANDPIPGASCVPPTGFDASSVALAAQDGETGFSVHANSTANDIILTRPSVLPAVADVSYELDNITNPTTPGTYYVRVYTYTSTDATGSSIQEGGIALSINALFNVGAEVPPFLRFCAGVTIVSFDCSSATSFLIDLGEFSTSQTTQGQSEMVAVTNAASGLSITLSGTTLTSGTNVIDPLLNQTPSSVGVSQFGINLRSNSSPGIGADPVGPGVASVNANYSVPNQYRFRPGDIVASSIGPNDYRKFTVSYVANIDGAQEPGVYATTISFICLANF